MEYKVQVIGNQIYNVYIYYWIFDSWTQEKIEAKAKKEGFYGKVYHPIICLMNTKYYVYFDWLREGFSIRVYTNFKVVGIDYIGQATLNQVYNACLNSSTRYYC